MNEIHWRSVKLHDLPVRMRIHPNRLHVWGIPLDLPDDCLERSDALLAVDEKDRANRFVRAADRRRFIISHAALRILLARYVGVASNDIRYTVGPHGKPALTTDFSPLAFNLSHSGYLAALAISSPARLGIDIEQVRNVGDARDIARSYFAPSEQAAIFATSHQQLDVAFLTCWTRKEAFVKALGGGLSVALDQFEVNLSHQNAALVQTGLPDATAAWTLVHLAPCEGYLGAAAIDMALHDVCFRLLEMDSTV